MHDDIAFAAGEKRAYAFDHLTGELPERAVGTPTDMRREHNAGNLADGVAGLQRLMVEHVKTGRNIATLQARKQRPRLDDLAARG